MHTVTYVAAFTSTGFPLGTTIGPVVASLMQGSIAIESVNLDSTGTAVFTSVPDGSYVLSVQATDGTPAQVPLGSPYTVAVVVSDPPVTVNIPYGGTVTIS